MLLGLWQCVEVKEDEEARAETIGKDLDVGAGTLAAGCPGGREGEVGFYVGFYFGSLRAEEEEDTEEGKGSRPRVQGVDDCGEDCGEDAEGGEGFVRDRSVYQCQRRRNGNLVPHCGLYARSERQRALGVVKRNVRSCLLPSAWHERISRTRK